MIITSSVYLPFPRSLVYSTYRDKLVELVPFLSNVRQIEPQSRQEQAGLLHLVNVWHGGGEIPALARAILSEAMLSWTDYAIWNDAEFTTNWRIETHAFTEAVHCVGKNRFVEEANGTRIDCSGELAIDPNKTGVPFFLAGKVAQTVEDFLSKKIEPNLLQVSEGVRHYLERS
ncbi:hypothetical protein H6F43_13930 [Leptolyngbya sp. FACHB-36]|uniref:hypothetical protein n=1 Tax=Leptolyngbya sp. FACHB-36 TaxID=2692808 RepID=UPI0016811EA0|nr:hypothetical protein [Leptolyngbya sp. FACHB-36]MBD2021275.1 hypothetical protein [Leptolyngbya sp. FACHB-36]